MKGEITHGCHEQFAASGIVPVVVLENAEDAVPTARALLAGGITTMEITFRTAAAADSIKAVADNVPEMLVGAGTVLNLEQCKLAVERGAKFIVAPGYDDETVAWCVENNIAVTPGCVTPTEIMMAVKRGLKAIKSLAGPFVGLKFIPTGGVNNDNIAEFAASPSIHAIGGSWVCPKADISAHNFDKITQLCKDARKALLGFEVAHVGINTDDADNAMGVAEKFDEAFGFGVKPGNSSNFAGTGVEVMKSQFLGEKGHLAVRTNKMDCAIPELEKRGFHLDMDTLKYKGDRINSVYLKDEIGGFAVHLLQK